MFTDSIWLILLQSNFSPDAAVQLVAKEGSNASVKLPSGEVRKIPLECMATIGQVGNLDHENISLGKAGRNRWLGKRPTVRGVVSLGREPGEVRDGLQWLERLGLTRPLDYPMNLSGLSYYRLHDVEHAFSADH